jgi:DNA-binding transcriptional LysR family regulator
MHEIDFNLLRVFDLLMDQRSVTRVAGQLGLTQSAVSHSLGRLRQMTGDALFVRGASGLQPTARAEAIAPGVRDGLVRLRAALSPPEFDAAQAVRCFTIAAGAYFCDLLVPALVARVMRMAPGVMLRVVPIADALVAALDGGTIDLVLAGTLNLPTRILKDSLFEEAMVWIAAAGNPIAAQPFDPALLATMPRITVLPPRPADALPLTAEQIARTLPQMSEHAEGSDTMTVYDTQTLIAIVARTEAVAIAPRRLATPAAAAGQIAILSPPIVTAPLSMFWHAKQRDDPGLAWLLDQVRQTVS